VLAKNGPKMLPKVSQNQAECAKTTAHHPLGMPCWRTDGIV